MIKAVEKIQEVQAIGVGIDTARFGHCAVFLRDDLKLAAARLEFRECPERIRRTSVSVGRDSPTLPRRGDSRSYRRGGAVRQEP
jgi:hypothetical protein